MSHRHRKGSILRQLTDRLGGVWRAVRDDGDFHYHWVAEDGREVRCYSESVLTYDGYSDTEFNQVYLLSTPGKLKELRRIGANGVIYVS